MPVVKIDPRLQLWSICCQMQHAATLRTWPRHSSAVDDDADDHCCIMYHPPDACRVDCLVSLLYSVNKPQARCERQERPRYQRSSGSVAADLILQHPRHRHKDCQDREKSQSPFQPAGRCRLRWLINRHNLQESELSSFSPRMWTASLGKLFGKLLRQGVGCRIRDLVNVVFHIFPSLGLGFISALLQLLDLLDVMTAMSQ